jgi:phosphopantothenoylcysteine decarboxylase
MNTMMYNHPFTAKHLAVVRDLGIHEIPAIAKHLACNDIGMGAMAEITTIAATVKALTRGTIAH